MVSQEFTAIRGHSLALYRTTETSNEKIKATFKVAFANIGGSSDEEEARAVAEYREDKSIKRKLLIKNYYDIDKSSDIYRIIEKLKSRHDKHT